MKITDLPDHPPQGYANWTRLYEEVLKHLRHNDPYFVIYHPVAPTLLRQKLSGTVEHTWHEVSELRDKVFEELWQNRLSKDEVNAMQTVFRRIHSLMLDSGIHFQHDKPMQDFNALLERLDKQWRADLLREV